MPCIAALLLLLLAVPLVAGADQSMVSPAAPEEVAFPGESGTLKGVLYKPAGEGPFPALLYNHGSAGGMLNQQAFERLGPLFASRGWVFFAPYRRGQGLSAGAGPYILDELASVQKSRMRGALPVLIAVGAALLGAILFATRRQRVWVRIAGVFAVAVLGTATYYLVSLHTRASAMVHLLETGQLADHVAAAEWLKKQRFVQPRRVATMGNSFGGIITVLASERLHYCAAVDASGGAQSWSLPVRARMVAAVRQSQAPVFFFQAENDYTVSPSRVLANEMRSAGKPFALQIYPPYGKSVADGHSFAWRGSDVWANDVFHFLSTHCRWPVPTVIG